MTLGENSTNLFILLLFLASSQINSGMIRLCNKDLYVLLFKLEKQILIKCSILEPSQPSCLVSS